MAETMKLLEGADPTNSVGRRVVAFFVDYLLLGLATLAVWYASDVTVVERATVAPGAGVYSYDGPAWQVVLVVVAPLLYLLGVFVVLQGTRGYTPGKLVLSLRCVKWDGRPPGLLKALLRTATLVVGTVVLGWIWWVVCFLFVVFSKGHRRPGDLLAATFVVDATFAGRIISIGAHQASAGPPSLYADEVTTGSGSGDRVVESAARRPMSPVYDRARDTYVVWDTRASTLMAFDKKTGSWIAASPSDGSTR